MNWHLGLWLLNTLCSTYTTIFVWSLSFTYLLHALKHEHVKFTSAAWFFTKVFRFLWPARKFMWFLGTPIDVYIYGFHVFAVLGYAWNFYVSFFFPDNFGDDDRKKKPSKIRSAVKALGHRLVVVPQ